MESKLTFLLRKLSTDQRHELVQALGMSLSTYYDRRSTPGRFTYDDAMVIKEHLDRWHNEDYNLAKLLEPVEIAA